MSEIWAAGRPSRPVDSTFGGFQEFCHPQPVMLSIRQMACIRVQSRIVKSIRKPRSKHAHDSTNNYILVMVPIITRPRNQRVQHREQKYDSKAEAPTLIPFCDLESAKLAPDIKHDERVEYSS